MGWGKGQEVEGRVWGWGGGGGWMRERERGTWRQIGLAVWGIMLGHRGPRTVASFHTGLFECHSATHVPRDVRGNRH